MDGGSGGGGGGHPDFLKLDFEIAVGHQTRIRDQIFEGVLDCGCPPVPMGQPRPCLVNFWPNFGKSPEHAQNNPLGCYSCSYLFLEHMYMSFIKIG